MKPSHRKIRLNLGPYPSYPSSIQFPGLGTRPILVAEDLTALHIEKYLSKEFKNQASAIFWLSIVVARKYAAGTAARIAATENRKDFW
ncbi:hypothetical protein N7478_001971 [Penicillium angulare]|uniref:uncharacterized protein n=1 Tax=Penicillium angulare TaxID=116970 RepID=UPI0025406EA2|nr:uncharacterized protein N7478_001971 [Penicillium angulare]KAJ5288941.1 hypothetical protein N7478_001971 [Penicillium angulare]